MRRSIVTQLLFMALCCVLPMETGCGTSPQSAGDTELLSVVAISRHGIRSPTLARDAMNLYTQRSQGFPAWPFPSDTAGNLSTVGQQNAVRLGSWYRDFYTSKGLFPPRGTCPAPGSVFVYADIFERTEHTAEGYVNGMFRSEVTPDCGVQVNYSNQKVDPYIDTAQAGLCKIDTVMDLSAFNARMGSDPSGLIRAYSAEIQTLQDVTQCCKPIVCATPTNPTPTSCSLLDLPTTVTTTGAVSFAKGTLFDVADALTETFELENAQGMPDQDCALAPGSLCVGWGAIPAGGLSNMTRLHVANMVDLTCQLPSFAQVGSTNLMWQLVGTMDQTLSGVKKTDMLAPVESNFTMIVAHDGNVSAIAEFLGGVTWKADGFEPNDPGPDGALVFELNRIKQSGQLIVRLFYVVATPDQMRSGTTLTLETPPQRLPLRIPACGGALDCSYDQFKTFVTDHIRPDCLVAAAPKTSHRPSSGLGRIEIGSQ